MNTGDNNFHSRNLLIHIQNTEWWVSCVNVGDWHFFPSLSSSNWVRVREEEAVKLSPVSCTEQQRRKIKKKGKKNWPSSRLLLFSCVTATFAPVWRTFTIRTIWILRTTGYRYHIFAYKFISEAGVTCFRARKNPIWIQEASVVQQAKHFNKIANVEQVETCSHWFLVDYRQSLWPSKTS